MIDYLGTKLRIRVFASVVFGLASIGVSHIGYAQESAPDGNPATETKSSDESQENNSVIPIPVDASILKDVGLLEDKTDGIDASLKVGSGSGEVTLARRTARETDVTYRFGGVSIAPAINQHYSRRISLCYEYQFLIDLDNSQVARQGGAVAGNLHILGGARRVTSIYPEISLLRRNTYNLSFVTSAAFQRYTVSLKDGTSRSLSGSTIEVLIGGEYRHDVSAGHAFGVEVLQTVYSIPTSVDRLTTNVQKWAAFWRIFI